MPARPSSSSKHLYVASLAGSILFHLALFLAFFFLGAQEEKNLEKKPKSTAKSYTLNPELIEVKKPKKEEPKPLPPSPEIPPTPTPEEKKAPSFLNTRDEQKAPEPSKDAAFIGARNTKLAGDRPSSPDGLENLPSLSGKKKRSDADLGFFDQKQQDGDLERETVGQKGLLSAQRPTPPSTKPQAAPTPPSLETEDAQSQNKETASPSEPPSPASPLSLPKEEQPPSPEHEQKPKPETSPTPPAAPPVPQTEKKGQEQKRPTQAISSQSSILEELKANAEKLNREAAQASAASLPSPAKPLSPAPQRPTPKAAPVFDPAFPNGARPGYRQEEQKTRITGRMSGQGVSAANVKSTPLGLYQAQFMRALNRNWDQECMNRRDFILPGTLKIRFILDKKGKTSGLQLLNRQGASEVQKGFTFKAIRETKVAPMNPAVLKELGEDSTEIIIDFFF